MNMRTDKKIVLELTEEEAQVLYDIANMSDVVGRVVNDYYKYGRQEQYGIHLGNLWKLLFEAGFK